MKREIRKEEQKAAAEALKKKLRMSVKTAYVSKKNRKKEEKEVEKVESTSSHESRKYREQMKMVDLSDVVFKDKEESINDHIL